MGFRGYLRMYRISGLYGDMQGICDHHGVIPPRKPPSLRKRFWHFIPKALGEHRRQDVQAKSLYENSFSLIPLDVACVGQKHHLSEVRAAALGLRVGQGSTRLSWGGSKRWNEQPPRLGWAVMYM